MSFARLHNYTSICIIIRMTKLARQQLIVELVHEGPLPNQQELVKVLARRGFPVTQATLSRDINELRLVRTPEGYTLPSRWPWAWILKAGTKLWARSQATTQCSSLRLTIRVPKSYRRALRTCAPDAANNPARGCW